MVQQRGPHRSTPDVWSGQSGSPLRLPRGESGGNSAAQCNRAIEVDLRRYLRSDHPELKRRGISAATFRCQGFAFGTACDRRKGSERSNQQVSAAPAIRNIDRLGLRRMTQVQPRCRFAQKRAFTDSRRADNEGMCRALHIEDQPPQLRLSQDCLLVRERCLSFHRIAGQPAQQFLQAGWLRPQAT